MPEPRSPWGPPISLGGRRELWADGWVEPEVQSFAGFADRSPAARLYLWGFGIGIEVEDRTCHGIAERLAALMPAELRVSDPGHGSRRLVVVDEPWAGSSDSVSVWLDGARILTREPPWRVAPQLRSHCDRLLIEGAKDVFVLRCGVVGWRGRAVLVTGRRGAGTSWLVRALSGLGAQYYSDAYAVIDARGRVHPYARVPTVDHEPLQDRTIEPAGAIGRRPPIPIGLAVDTEFDPVASWTPTVLRGANAVLPLLDRRASPGRDPGTQMRYAGLLAPGLMTLSGPRPDAEQVAISILSRVDALETASP